MGKNTKSDGKKYTRVKTIYFDLENPQDRILYELLSKAPRRQNRLIYLMALEFMNNFSITEDVSREELTQIMDHYEIIDRLAKKRWCSNPPVITVETPIQSGETPKENIPLIEEKPQDIKDVNKELFPVPEKTLKKDSELFAPSKETIQNPKDEDPDFNDLKYALSGFGF